MVGAKYRACVWSQLDLGPFWAPRKWWPPPNWDLLASQATQGHSLVV